MLLFAPAAPAAALFDAPPAPPSDIDHKSSKLPDDAGFEAGFGATAPPSWLGPLIPPIGTVGVVGESGVLDVPKAEDLYCGCDGGNAPNEPVVADCGWSGAAPNPPKAPKEGWDGGAEEVLGGLAART